MSKEYFVYIMTNKSRTLYTGVTNDLMRRVYEHKNKLIQGFTSKYNIQYLVYYESTSSIHVALEREKQIKGWLRAKKIALINSMNPDWKDLPPVSLLTLLFTWIRRLKFKRKVKQIMRHYVSEEWFIK